jgi:phosphatidylserine/phosphatidylglycerophosphate/cardiolipin synthase-like enzyme
MVENLVWLALLATGVLAFTFCQQKEGRLHGLKKEIKRLQNDLRAVRELLREKERNLDLLQKSSANLLKWKDRAIEAEKELRDAKGSQEFIASKRLEDLEAHFSAERDSQPLFLATSHPPRRHTLGDELLSMLDRAEFDVVLASPWMKRDIWERMRPTLKRFCRRGGKLRVLMRGKVTDFSLGFSDDIGRDVEELGGELLRSEDLHAKLYMVDRREAIISSANLTKSGWESNLEAGIWINDPAVIKEACRFIDEIIPERRK